MISFEDYNTKHRKNATNVGSTTPDNNVRLSARKRRGATNGVFVGKGAYRAHACQPSDVVSDYKAHYIENIVLTKVSATPDNRFDYCTGFKYDVSDVALAVCNNGVAP